MRNGEEDLDAVWTEHRADTRARLGRLHAVAAAAASGILDDEARAEGLREAHTLAGAAAIFGFAEAVRIAREIEGMLLSGDAALEAGARVVTLAHDLERTLDRDRPPQGSAEGTRYTP